MTVCPIAIAVGCKKCPAFGICPLKGVLGDQGSPQAPQAKSGGASSAQSQAKKK